MLNQDTFFKLFSLIALNLVSFPALAGGDVPSIIVCQNGGQGPAPVTVEIYSDSIGVLVNINGFGLAVSAIRPSAVVSKNGHDHLISEDPEFVLAAAFTKLNLSGVAEVPAQLSIPSKKIIRFLGCVKQSRVAYEKAKLQGAIEAGQGDSWMNPDLAEQGQN